jgi:hypothetical protein
MPDPFAHGTPVGDSHTWIDPSRRDCPDCECCTIRLCRDARESQRTCVQVAPMRDAALVHDCPCTASLTRQETLS